MKIDKKKIKNNLKKFSINFGFASIAALFCLAERGTIALDEILKGPSRGLGKSYDRMMKQKNFWDYYDELKDMQRNSVRTALWRLEKKGLVKKKEGQYKLTIQGIKIVNIIRKEDKQKEWDGRWRIIMFDIPEKKRRERDWLRSQLLLLEYQPLQKSIFLGKQPIDEDIWRDFMKRNLNRYIRLITVGEIDDEKILDNF